MKKKFIDIVSKDKVSGFEKQARKDIANKEQLDKEFEEKLRELEKRIMNYKLINKNSCSKNGVKREGESCTLNNNCIYPNCCEYHLCNKITIDGFDYYVSGEKINEGSSFVDNNKLFKCRNIFETGIEDDDGLLHKFENCKKVIATNNPNIDIPKVVDEVEQLAREFATKPVNPLNSIGTMTCLLSQNGFEKGYNKSQETHPFSEEDVRFMLSEAFKASQEGYQITSDEIIQIWKEQRLKIVYYDK